MHGMVSSDVTTHLVERKSIRRAVTRHEPCSCRSTFQSARLPTATSKTQMNVDDFYFTSRGVTSVETWGGI